MYPMHSIFPHRKTPAALPATFHAFVRKKRIVGKKYQRPSPEPKRTSSQFCQLERCVCSDVVVLGVWRKLVWN